jgi:hypothetical protein
VAISRVRNLDRLQVINFQGPSQCPPPSQDVQLFLQSASSPLTCDLSCCRQATCEQPAAVAVDPPSHEQRENLSSTEEESDDKDVVASPSEEDVHAMEGMLAVHPRLHSRERRMSASQESTSRRHQGLWLWQPLPHRAKPLQHRMLNKRHS